MLTGRDIGIVTATNEKMDSERCFHTSSKLEPKRTGIHLQRMSVQKKQRILKNDHKPCVVWLTGLSGSGKSSAADALEKSYMRSVIKHTPSMATMSDTA